MTLLEMKNISKSFGGVKALQDVQLTVNKGEIIALMGENGAGKSTLMNILTGVYTLDKGTIIFDGKRYDNPTIRQMENAGIAFVHQELNVINDLAVFENIFLNREIKGKFNLLDKKQMIKETSELFDSIGVNINPTEMVSNLKTSEKQLLEICRALHMDAKLLILDEPTTSLSNEEVEHLFKVLRKMKEQGKSFIFISHKMPEIFEIADAYTVFRNGQYISSGLIKDTNPNQMTFDMTGSEYADKEVYASRELGDVVLKVDNLSGKGFKNISFELKRGEVLAITGLAGCGATELMQTLFGVQPIEGGSIKLEGRNLNGGIKYFMKNGVAMLPGNRKENSVVPDLTIIENMSLAEHRLSEMNQIISNKREEERYQNQKASLRIKAEKSSDPINSLSGGNQQKVFLARWLNTEANILLFDNPTQGVDVGAKAEIYQLVMEFAKQGKSIIINTLEIPEIMKVADRCAVLYEGKITRIFEHNEINEKDVMLYSTNAVNAEGDK